MDLEHLKLALEAKVDVLQVGTRNALNYSLLKEIGIELPPQPTKYVLDPAAPALAVPLSPTLLNPALPRAGGPRGPAYLIAAGGAGFGQNPTPPGGPAPMQRRPRPPPPPGRGPRRAAATRHAFTSMPATLALVSSTSCAHTRPKPEPTSYSTSPVRRTAHREDADGSKCTRRETPSGATSPCAPRTSPQSDVVTYATLRWGRPTPAWPRAEGGPRQGRGRISTRPPRKT